MSNARSEISGHAPTGNGSGHPQRHHHHPNTNWENRSVTKEEGSVLAIAANAFQQIVACAGDGWSIRDNGPVSAADRAELHEILTVLLFPYNTEQIKKRLAWIMDNKTRYEKLCARLERVQELLGNPDKGPQLHPFTIQLAKGHEKKECNAFTSGLRSGTHLKSLRSTYERWVDLKEREFATA